MITIPTLNQLYVSIKADIEAEYGTSIPVFGKVFLRVMALVQAGKLKLFYLAIGKLQKNIFVDTAETENSGGTLERFGRIKLGRNPFPARAGQYLATITGSIGATIPAQTTFKTNDDSLNPGKLFILDNAHTMVTASDQITIRALEAGTGSKLSAGDALTATAPIANVNSAATVDSESISPLDAEDLEEYRQASVQAYQLEPNGGSPSDYRIWARDAQGVAEVYPFARTGASAEVNLYIEATPADSTDGQGTPGAGILADVETVVELDPDTTKPINERGRRPLGAFRVYYLPVSVKQIDIDIADFEGLTAEIQADIFDALTEQMDGTRPFVGGADPVESKNDSVDKNKIIATILSVKPGAVFGDVTLSVDTVEVNSFLFTSGDIPHLNSVSYS
jgi:uncharacterized phage protein gp47/JayE